MNTANVMTKKSPGRPPRYGRTMKQTALRLPQDQIDWLKRQKASASETVRQLIKEEMFIRNN